MADRKTKLSPIQQRFVEEYLVDLNATAAYKRAGYKAKTDAVAASAASELLRVPKVQDAIQTLQQARSQETEANASRVIKELLCLAYSDIGDIIDFTQTEPRMRPACDIPEKARRAIASIKVRRQLEGGKDEAREVEIIEYKLWDKNSATDKLMKHLGMFAPDKHEHSGPGGKPIQMGVQLDYGKLYAERPANPIEQLLEKAEKPAEEQP